VRDIESRAGAVPMEVLSRRHGYAERTLEREFQMQLGVTPREFISLNRFRQALRRIQANTGRAETFSDIAQACGYYDQAHMAREFRRFAGAPPSLLKLSE
jgi:AraC-like DNA-binding protein